MKKHISFPSIEQFKNVIADINRSHNFVGLDENGVAIYDPSRPKPVLAFKGTVKLHGTNFGVSYNELEGIWAQSRENIVTPTPETHYVIEFEDGIKIMVKEGEIIGGMVVDTLNNGDVINV